VYRGCARLQGFPEDLPKEKLSAYQAENQCPVSDLLCEETVGFHQRMLLGTRQDMDDIADAVAKVYEHRANL